jgi:hypothetical protein
MPLIRLPDAPPLEASISRRWMPPAALLLLAAAVAPLAQPPRPGGESYAFLVACQEYESRQLRKLACPRRDVQDFAKALEGSG